jgi:hypothetical protein
VCADLQPNVTHLTPRANSTTSPNFITNDTSVSHNGMRYPGAITLTIFGAINSFEGLAGCHYYVAIAWLFGHYACAMRSNAGCHGVVR